MVKIILYWIEVCARFIEKSTFYSFGCSEERVQWLVHVFVNIHSFIHAFVYIFIEIKDFTCQFHLLACLFACLLLAIIFITSDADDIIYKQNMHMDNNHEPSCYMHRAAPRRILNQCIRMYEIGCNVKTCLEFVCVSRLTWTLLVILASFAHLFVRRNTLNCIFRVHLPVK